MLEITPLPAFNDNYLWLITHPESTEAYVVDPGDGSVVYAALRAKSLSLRGILITHWHPDHTGGINYLLEKSPINTPVYGPLSDKIPQVTHPLDEGDSILLYDQYPFKVLETHGHTLEHIVYYSGGECWDRAESPTLPSRTLLPMLPPMLFCGDALFAGGCGRFAAGPESIFQGSAEQMYASLNKLSLLPDDTLVYCAHEYTLANLAFAQRVDPSNDAITERIKEEQKKRDIERPTIPSTIGLEKQTNPFLRTQQASIKNTISAYWKTQYTRDSDVLLGLRRWKDEV